MNKKNLYETNNNEINDKHTVIILQKDNILYIVKKKGFVDLCVF